ncbi:MAG: hypothetical protein ACRDG7_19590 [Candidatus Limnocylindria bacterium]
MNETKMGWPCDPKSNLAACFAEVAAQTAASVRRRERETATLKVLWADSRGVRLRGAVTLPVTKEPARPGKIGKAAKAGLRSGPLLDSLALREEGFALATDREAYEALAEYAAEIGLNGRVLRTMNDWLAILLAARAGCELPPNADVFRHGAPA